MLITAAADPEFAYVDECHPVETITDPHRQADAFLKKRHRHRCGWTLRFWGRRWWRWDGKTYLEVQREDIASELTASIKEEFDRFNREQILRWEDQVDRYEEETMEARAENRKATQKAPPSSPPCVPQVTTRVVSNALQALQSMVRLDPDASPPEWIGEGPRPFPAEEVLIANNGLLHLQSYLQGREDCIVPHTSALFSTRAALGYDVSLQAPDPQTWLTFLSQLWPGDEQSIECLQEWCGYLLTQDTWLQKILLMVGPRRGGKGTIGRVLRSLVGAEATNQGKMARLSATSRRPQKK
jgi:putative DNA primase/helicase